MKRASRKSKLVVGAFVVMVGLLIVAATMFFGDDLKIFKTSSRYFASFRNASGLHSGAPLKMGGVDIGTVEAIAIDAAGDSPRILLTLVIYFPHSELIKEDSEASLDTQGMLGDKFLNVTTGSASSRNLPAGSFLKTKENTELSAVVTQSTDIIKTVGQTTMKIDQFVDSFPDSKAMKSVTSDFQSSARELKELLTLMNAQNSGLRTLSDETTAKRFAAVLSSLEIASAHLESVAMKVDSGKGTLGALVNDVSLYDDMRKLMGRANRSKAAKFMIQQVLEGQDAEAKEK